jgi:hypothetical protein
MNGDVVDKELGWASGDGPRSVLKAIGGLSPKPRLELAH